MAEEREAVRYNPSVFEVRSIEEAKRIALTDEGMPTDERWERETPYLGEEIAFFLRPTESSLLLDYGCGIGRMAKDLIARCGCSVLGVDISQSMRQLAPGYVLSGKFAACASASFDAMVRAGLRLDGAIAIWSLQHSPNVEEDIARLDGALKPGAALFVCNVLHAAIPTNRGWVDTGFDIKALLADAFDQVEIASMSRARTSAQIARAAFLGKYRKRRNASE